MTKPKRKKVQREWLEGQLSKYERRIQRLAQEAYYIRQAIELLDTQEAVSNQSKGEISDAICETGIEAGAGIGGTDSNTGEPNISHTTALEAVLAEQPTELPEHS